LNIPYPTNQQVGYKNTGLPIKGKNFEKNNQKISNFIALNFLMVHKKTHTGTYRFGFNGQEKDDEITGITGSHIATKFREYDSRIGRWLSIDPKMAKYPAWSPYNFAFNNPIWLNDPDGDDPHDNKKKFKERTSEQSAEAGTPRTFQAEQNVNSKFPSFAINKQAKPGDDDYGVCWSEGNGYEKLYYMDDHGSGSDGTTGRYVSHKGIIQTAELNQSAGVNATESESVNQLANSPRTTNMINQSYSKLNTNANNNISNNGVNDTYVIQKTVIITITSNSVLQAQAQNLASTINQNEPETKVIISNSSTTIIPTTSTSAGMDISIITNYAKF
jgi:RHS repeat-associated protein